MDYSGLLILNMQIEDFLWLFGGIVLYQAKLVDGNIIILEYQAQYH